MPKINRNDIVKKPRVDVKHSRSGEIKKVVFPHETQFGIPQESKFLNDVKFHNGLTGSLTKLTDGTSYIIAGSNVTILTGSKGQITISSTGGGGGGSGDIEGVTAGNGLSGGGTTATVSLALDLNELSAADVSVANDSIVIIDNDDSNSSKKESIVDFISAIASTGLDASSGQLSVDVSDFMTNGVNNRVITATGTDALNGEENLTFDGSTFSVTGNAFVSTSISGSLLKSNFITGSLTTLNDGSSYLVAGNDVTITSSSNGSVTIASNPTIGSAEDGSYTDGLFTDITNSTAVGTVIDRFNEILKALAPGPAPNLDDVDFNNSSVSGKLSFGASNTVSGYTNSNTAAGFSAIDVDGTFGSSTSGNNLRIGILDGSTSVSGDLNEDVTADTHSSGQTNYVANAFGNANQGTLKLEVNGVVIHSVVLTGSALGHIGTGVPGSGTGASSNSNGSGFASLSATGSANFSDATELDLFQHRTGQFLIRSTDQRNGWNYARIVHTLDSGDIQTNYIEWINDPDSNALAAAGDAFDTLSMTGNVNLSGVKYHTAGTAQYRVRVTNAYKNVYSTSNVTYTTSNCTISAASMPTAGNDENKVLHLTGSATINASSLLNESISARAVVPHPLKSDLTATNQTISNILLWGYSNNSTVLSETFRRENFRIQENSYANQAAITHSDQAWDGSESLAGSDAGHNTGLMFYNQRLVSPSQGANSGNFGGISNGPGSNVNYSGITSGTRTFYRYFQNNSGGSKTGFSVTINGSGTIVASGTSLNSSRIKVFFKLPETSGGQATGYMDLATAFSTGQVSDDDGCLEGSLDSSLNATNTVTFGTQFIADDEYIVLKIQADAAYTGHISQITVSWS